jgi:hypothetical protein
MWTFMRASDTGEGPVKPCKAILHLIAQCEIEIGCKAHTHMRRRPNLSNCDLKTVTFSLATSEELARVCP